MPLKCEFFKWILTYLGHVASEEGIQTDPRKVEVNWKWPTPSNVTEVCSFQRFTSYYCKFISKYAQLPKPLYKLISGENAARKQNLIKWDQECQEAFDKLKRVVHKHTNFGICRFHETFRLHTDASILGPGAVFYQEHDGVEKVISYATQSTLKI